jgi:type IV secretion system protein TrbL
LPFGIGTGLFGEFTRDFGANQPTLEDALALVLASLSLLGLGIFGPGIATGLVAGAPQLGAGAAVGTAQAIGGAAVAGVVGARAGLAVLGRAAGAISRAAPGASLESIGARAAAPADGPPAWARSMGRQQKIKQGISTAAQAVRSGDHSGGSSSVPLSEDR